MRRWRRISDHATAAADDDDDDYDDNVDDGDGDGDYEIRLPAEASDIAAVTRETMLREALGLPSLPTNQEEKEKILAEEATVAASVAADPSEPQHPKKVCQLPLFAMLGF